MPRTPYSQGPCANCGAHRLLKYAHRTMCCRYKCQRAAAAQRQARLAGGGADDAVVPTFCYKIEAVLGMRFCDPDQLIGKNPAKVGSWGRVCPRPGRISLFI